MGVNHDHYTRAHRRCCPERHPITIYVDVWAGLFGRKFQISRFAGGGWISGG